MNRHLVAEAMENLPSPPARQLLPATTRDPGLDSLLGALGQFARRPMQPVRCGICLAAVTNREERMVIDGRNRFQFTNPRGMSFDVLCFRSALGCYHHGEPTDYYSWFEGYSWQFAHCGDCDTHLGWYYRAPDGDEFYGLMATLLVES